MTQRKLKIWNGRGWGSRYSSNYVDHAYVCAYSRADAVRLINEVVGYQAVDDRELKEYWSEGVWGDTMQGIEKERGLWITKTQLDKTPTRIK